MRRFGNHHEGIGVQVSQQFGFVDDVHTVAVFQQGEHGPFHGFIRAAEIEQGSIVLVVRGFTVQYRHLRHSLRLVAVLLPCAAEFRHLRENVLMPFREPAAALGLVVDEYRAALGEHGGHFLA